MFGFKKKKRAIVVDTNVLLRMGRLCETGILKKLNGQIFVPWSVLEEMIAFRKEAIYVKRFKKEYGDEPYFMRKLTKKEAKLRRRRHKSTLNAWPIFSTMIEEGSWRITGSSSGQYFEVFGKKNGSDTSIGEDIGSSDVRIIAACKALQKQALKVVLLTRDGGLRRRAEEEKISTQSGLSNLIKN